MESDSPRARVLGDFNADEGSGRVVAIVEDRSRVRARNSQLGPCALPQLAVARQRGSGEAV